MMRVHAVEWLVVGVALTDGELTARRSCIAPATTPLTVGISVIGSVWVSRMVHGASETPNWAMRSIRVSLAVVVNGMIDGSFDRAEAPAGGRAPHFMFCIRGIVSA